MTFPERHLSPTQGRVRNITCHPLGDVADFRMSPIRGREETTLPPFCEQPRTGGIRTPPTDPARAACAGARPDVARDSRSGESWFLTGFHFTSYNHCSTPNPRLIDCTIDGRGEDLHQLSLRDGVFSARSRHPGGVNCLLMDGSVRFVKDAVSLPTWRALSTRSSGDVVSIDDL